MKSTAFGDRAKQLAIWFQEWNQCEQTIALYSLLTKVSATQARFFTLVLEHILKNGQDSQELVKMENDANNPAFLSAIHSETDDLALKRLLTHIPLLHPGNDEARDEYLKLLPKVLFGSIEDPNYLYQCRQLLSLALVHPAFPRDDRDKLAFWLSRLEEKCRNIAERNGSGTGSSSTSSNSGTYLYQQIPFHQHQQMRASTLPHHSHQQYITSSTSPPRRIYQLNTGPIDDSLRKNGSNRIYITLPHNSSQSLPFVNQSFDSFEIDTYPFVEEEDEPNQKAFTLQTGQSMTNLQASEHCPTPNGYDEYIKKSKLKSLSLPVNRAPSSCSLPASLDDQSMHTQWKPGMKDVPTWLKSLRLHKYQQLFIDMSYESLLEISSEFLESKNVTKGARDKILLSIKKLHQRAETLAEIEQEISKPGELLSCITQLKQILRTPIKPFVSPNRSNISSNTTTAVELENDEKPTKSTTSTKESKERKLSVSSHEGSPSHLLVPTKEDGSSGGDSSGSTPPSSPRMRRSSSISSVEDLLAKEFPQDDLPSLITKTIGKVFSQLMMHTETNEDNLTQFISVLDTAMCHEAFVVNHKKMFFEWKQQCQQTLRVLSPKKSPRNRGWASAFTIAGNPPQPKVPSYIERKPNSRRGNSRGNSMGPKVTMSLMGCSPLSSSTLPRANPPRQFQPPFPPPYYPPRGRCNSSGQSIKQQPIPIPSVIKAHRYVNMTIPSPMEEQQHMDELCKSVTEHALEDKNDF